jgi:hypothetical protein
MRDLVYHVVDRVDQTQHLSRNTDTDDLLHEISSCNSRLHQQTLEIPVDTVDIVDAIDIIAVQ